METPRHGKAVGDTGFGMSIYNMSNSVVGMGILALPRATAGIGYVGLGVLVVMTVFAHYSSVLIARCLRMERDYKSFGDLAAACTSDRGSKVLRILLDIMVNVFLVGVAIIYLILLGTNIHLLWPSINIHNGVLIAAGLFTFHIFLKSLKDVALVSLISMLCVIVIVVAVVTLSAGSAGKAAAAAATSTHHDIFVAAKSAGGSIATYAFALGGHPAFPAIYDHLKEERKYESVSLLSFIFIGTLYFAISVAGYVVFGTAAVSPIYKNFEGFVSLAVFRFLVVIPSIVVALSFPLIIIIPEQVIEVALGVDEHSHERIARGSIRLLVLGSCTAAAYVLVNVFGPFLDLIGSLIAIHLSYTFPSAAFLTLNWKKNRASVLVILLNLMIIIVGIVASIFGSWQAVLDIMAVV